MCIRPRLDVTPKTTEENRIVCTSKSEAEVTNNKIKLRLRYCTIGATKLTTDRHEASRGLFATAELLVELQATARENLSTVSCYGLACCDDEKKVDI